MSLLLVCHLDNGVDLAIVVAVHQLVLWSLGRESLLDDHASTFEPGSKHVRLDLDDFTSLSEAYKSVAG